MGRRKVSTFQRWGLKARRGVHGGPGAQEAESAVLVGPAWGEV